MELVCEEYSALCELREFIINGVSADYEDFGNKSDHGAAFAQEYGCGDMRFVGKRCTQEILDKYKITVDEYNEACEVLENKLSFGACGWCV